MGGKIFSVLLLKGQAGLFRTVWRREDPELLKLFIPYDGRVFPNELAFYSIRRKLKFYQRIISGQTTLQAEALQWLGVNEIPTADAALRDFYCQHGQTGLDEALYAELRDAIVGTYISAGHKELQPQRSHKLQDKALNNRLEILGLPYRIQNDGKTCRLISLEEGGVKHACYSTKSKADARRKGEVFRAKYELKLLCGGEPIRPRKLFTDWAIQCLELYKKPYVKANTYCGTYLLPVNKRLIPFFGDKAVDEILPMQVQGYINQISRGLSPETVKKDFTILAFIMKYAVENGLRPTNPASSAIRLPKIEHPQKRAYTQAEYDTAYRFAASPPLGLSVMVLMETGISRSELLGLRWEDFDPEKGILHIRQGLVAYYLSGLEQQP